MDLHAFLPPRYDLSTARGVWDDGTHIYVVGTGTVAATGLEEALMWVSPIPEPAGGLLLLTALSALPLLLRRRNW